MPCLWGYCGGNVALIVSVITPLHRSCFHLEFDTFFESIGQVVAYLWQTTIKRSSFFKSSPSVVIYQCQKYVTFKEIVPALYKNFFCILKRVNSVVYLEHNNANPFKNVEESWICMHTHLQLIDIKCVTEGLESFFK